ncbi:MAG: hypothetical protein FWG90_09985 [Oscillospiraceae bacterium]|nr:hypothetical protein [Oscillospiraceae bacterium]
METVVTKTLHGLGVKFVVTSHQNPALTCEEVSKERGVALSQVLKCMVCSDEEGHFHIMLIPGNKRLSKMKKIRRIAKVKKLDFAPRNELKDKLGLVVGAISPFQFMGKAKFYIDQTVLDEDMIDISSGSLNAGVMIKTKDLVNLLEPVICDIVDNRELIYT